MNNTPYFKDIKIGIISGSTHAIVGMPFLTWKFAIQGNIPLPKFTEPWKYYRGSIQQITAHTPNTVIQILSNSILLNYYNKKNISIYEKLACSSIASIVGAIIFTPIDNLTIIQQIKKCSLLQAIKREPPSYSLNCSPLHYPQYPLNEKPLLPPNNTPKKIPLREMPWERIPNYTYEQRLFLLQNMIIPSNTKINLLQIMQPKLFSLYRGLDATIIRESIYCSGFLTFGPLFTSKLKDNSLFFQNNHSISNLLGSCGSGVFSTLISHPFDTAKTRIQSDLIGNKYISIGQTIYKIIKQEGIRSLFIGIMPRSLQISSAFFIINSVKDYYK